MNLKLIEDIDKSIGGKLTGFLYHLFCHDELYYMTEIASLPVEGGVGLVLKGTAPLQERREQFLQMYKGIEHIAIELRKIAEHEEKTFESIQSGGTLTGNNEIKNSTKDIG